MKRVIQLLEIEKSTLNDLIKYESADYHDLQMIVEIDQALQLIQSEQDCDVCRPITEGFYLGGTCQKCLKPFREFKQS